jgi:hypothetical protein
MVARNLGARDGLSIERTYTLKTLPAAFGRNLARAFHLDLAGPVQALAIAGGLATTVVGYVRGMA